MSGYSELINSIIGNVYRAGIATKILQHMDRIRNVSDPSQARRWIMELIQNAGDTSYDDLPVQIQIMLCKDSIKFSHTGRPFRIKDILSLINQVSSKDPGDNTVGKFGTGFMTTFLLSEIVEIRSYLRDTDENGEPLPYKPFCITIDRTGHTKEDILDGINAAAGELLDAVASDTICEELDRTAYNTCFTYCLDSERSYNSAVMGINDLKKNIRCIMLFAPKIDSIEIIDASDGEPTSCIYKRRGMTDIGERLKTLDITVNTDGAESSESTVCVSSGELTEAAYCFTDAEGNYHFEPLDTLTSRIFVNFPLIGTESFPFPLIINDIGFRPNEPRSGITLVDNEQSVDSQCNKDIISKAVSLYEIMLTEAVKCGFSDIENIIGIPRFVHDKEMSDSWVKENIFNGLYNIIKKVPLINTSIGRVSMDTDGLYIIAADNEEEGKRISSLASKLEDTMVPADNTDWWGCLKNYGLPEEKVLTLKKMTENTEDFAVNRLDKDNCSIAVWCRELYDAAMQNNELRTEINSGQACIFPNRCCMSEDKVTFSPINKLKNGRHIPDRFIEVSCILDRLSSNGALKINEELIAREFEDIPNPLLAEYELAALISYIELRTDRAFRVSSFSSYKNEYLSIWHSAWIKLLECMPDKEFFEICRRFYSDELSEQLTLEAEFPKQLWHHTVCGLLDSIRTDITEAKNLNGLMKRISAENEDEVFSVLNSIIAAYQRFVHSVPEDILPDQHGIFTERSGNYSLFFSLEKLHIDRIENEPFKEILSKYSDLDSKNDIYALLVDRRIDVSKLSLPEYTDEMTANRICNLVDRSVKMPLSEDSPEHQEACTILLSWIMSDPESAAKYFPNYSEPNDQMKLLTPKEAVKQHQKAKQLDELLTEYSCGDVMELVRKIADNSPSCTKLEKENENEELRSFAYSIDVDFELSDLDEGMSFAEKQDYLRRIGDSGEKHACEDVKRSIIGRGYTLSSESDNILEFISEDKAAHIIVEHPDNGTYHQKGWDIKITVDKEDDETEIHYVEVKTHTSTSVLKNSLKLTDSQLSLAVRKSDHYHVCHTRINRNCFDAESITYFTDIIGEIRKNTLAFNDSAYMLRIQS